MEFEFGMEVMVEFHSRQDYTQSPGTVRIHACLLRFPGHGTMKELEKISMALGETLASLTSLEIIVLETGDQINDDEVSSLLGSLRNICRVEVQHRTCDEGHKLALQAKKSPSCSTGGELLSPFWCLTKQGTMDTWNWW